MKRKSCFKNVFFSLLVCFSLMFLSCPISAQSFADSSPRQFNAEESIFLRSPTYSAYYDQKVYTLDSYDNILKTYNTSTHSFESEYLSLKEYTIIDAMYLDDNLFILSSKESIFYLLQVNIVTKEVKTLTTDTISAHHTKLFVSSATLDTDNLYIISLTNISNEEDVTPVLIFANQADFTLNFECSITFDTLQSNIASVQTNLYKMIALASSTNEIRLIFVHGSSVSFTHISLDTVKTNTAQITSITPLYEALDNTIVEVEITSVNLITISNISHFAITYAEPKSQNQPQNTQIYAYNIGDGTNTYFEKKSYITVSNSPYILTNNEYLAYPDGQSVHYDKITLVDGMYTAEGDSFANPVLEISYFEDSNFIYKTAYEDTPLLKNPWDAEIITTIAKGADLIQIGTSSVKSNGYQITDYVYCLYTANNKNYTGYVKLENTYDKSPVDISNYKHNPTFTVYAGTKLYSLPTKVLSSTSITDSAYSTVVREIDANLKVHIVNTICEYTANNSTMIKVKVNEDVGYIDCNSIIDPPERIDFLTTNAIIKQDGTKVYANADSSSSVNDVLNKNKTVQIIGKRNAENGFTYIMYNDEYGNVLDGYIKTDYLETVTWTTLQIIGCVLIAINLGLLILILVFRKRKIGNDGQKYKNEEKPNYKEEAVQNSTEE